MKNKLVFFLTIAFFISSLLIAPSVLDAAPIEYSGNGHYYELIEEQVSWAEARDTADSMGGYLVTVTTAEEAEFINNNFTGIEFWTGGYQPDHNVSPAVGWEWITGETWSYTNWNTGEPNDYDGDEYVLVINNVWNDAADVYFLYYIVEYDSDPNAVEEIVTPVIEEEPVITRIYDMTCWQVWVNEDNNFEFIFWWTYYNNNWVQIYEMDGNLVWEIDIPKDKPHFEVDLPDGIYKVQTFHEAGHILQEFYIGKP